MCSQNPFLQYHFESSSGIIETTELTNPREIITAEKVEQVIPALQQIQCACLQGNYCAGYVSYEAAPAFDPNFKVHENPRMPLLWFGVFDPGDVKIYTQSNKMSNKNLLESSKYLNWKPSVDRSEYQKAIEKIKNEILEGNSYQVNYTMRLYSDFYEDEYAFFQRLVDVQKASYSAFLKIGNYSILSVSPELFFRWDGKNITTKPMKGTMKRGRWPEEDEMFALKLASSEKERAENIMIVDLLRNDMSRIATPESIQVPAVFTIEKYPTVYQMTSTVTGETMEGVKLSDIFTALFPCGSITGAPKISTMKIISELEQSPREVYCGSIGIIEPFGRNYTFNVAIRTVIIDSRTHIAQFGVGGGITWDSTSEGEYEEVLTKTNLLFENTPDFELLETLKLKNGEYFLLEEHLQRLASSSNYFGINVDMEAVESSLRSFSTENPVGSFRVKARISQTGCVSIEAEPIPEQQVYESPLPVILASEPINSQNKFLYHKTTYRNHFEPFLNQKQQFFDVLLWNEQGFVTEFTIGNVVVELDGMLWTPPIEVGLLPGTFRSHLIKNGCIKERLLTKRDLEVATNLWFINSVREWVPVKLIKPGNNTSISREAET